MTPPMDPTAWHHGRLALFDLETTGVDPHRDRIVTAAIIEAGGGHKTVTRTWLVDPGIEIPDGAAEIHGITTEKARAEGRQAAQAIKEIGADLLSCSGSGLPIIGHGVSYDLTLLHAELTRHGHTTLAGALAGIAPVVDTFVIDKQVDRYRRGKRTLVPTCAHYGIELREDDAHGAAADALAAGRLAWVLASGHPAALNIPLEDLHREQVEWKRQQAESLAAYFRKKGQPDDVSRDWPIQAFPDGWAPDQHPTPREDAA